MFACRYVVLFCWISSTTNVSECMQKRWSEDFSNLFFNPDLIADDTVTDYLSQNGSLDQMRIVPTLQKINLVIKQINISKGPGQGNQHQQGTWTWCYPSEKYQAVGCWHFPTSWKYYIKRRCSWCWDSEDKCWIWLNWILRAITIKTKVCIRPVC